MDQPPKPILDRLPSLPPRPSSRSNLTSPVREEASRKRLTARLEAMSVASLEPPAVDPRTASVAALMVSNFVSEETIRRRFIPLVGAKLFDVNALEDLPVAARFVLRILPKLGDDLDQRDMFPAKSLLATVKGVKEEMLRVAGRHLADIDEAHGRLVTIRLGDGPADDVHDLRMLADLWRDYGETLALEAGDVYRPDAGREARELATHLELALLGPLSAEDEEWRSYLYRALAMLVPLYEEVCRAGRFLFHGEKPEARFPTLASVARVRRRLKREATRRTESLPPPPAFPPPPSSRTSRPPGKSAAPEMSLIDVSDADESALADALISVLPSAPSAGAVPVSVPATAGVPHPARMIDPMEIVTLDFSATPSAGEDADRNLDTADLDLEVTYESESNFYADVAGHDLGLFVATYVVKSPGTPFGVRLSLPQLDEPILVTGTVRWVREFSPSIEAPPGMGVALAPLRPGHQKAVEAFMKVRAPLLHDE
jgi:hypothetical protein